MLTAISKYDKPCGLRHAPIIKDNFRVPLKLEYIRNPNFVGRKTDLDKLHELASKKDENAVGETVAVIHATGQNSGVLKCVFMHEEDFKPTCWINGRDLQTIWDCFVAFAQQLVDHYAQLSETPPSYLWIAQYLGMCQMVSDFGTEYSSIGQLADIYRIK